MENTINEIRPTSRNNDNRMTQENTQQQWSRTKLGISFEGYTNNHTRETAPTDQYEQREMPEDHTD
eukprot:4206378-Prorocentrum_lima.AAC.1